MFLKNAGGKIPSNIDNQYIRPLSIVVWVMPVSTLLFATGVSEFNLLPQPALATAILLSISIATGCRMFWHQAGNAATLTALPLTCQCRK